MHKFWGVIWADDQACVSLLSFPDMGRTTVVEPLSKRSHLRIKMALHWDAKGLGFF